VVNTVVVWQHMLGPYWCMYVALFLEVWKQELAIQFSYRAQCSVHYMEIRDQGNVAARYSIATINVGTELQLHTFQYQISPKSDQWESRRCARTDRYNKSDVYFPATQREGAQKSKIATSCCHSKALFLLSRYKSVLTVPKTLSTPHYTCHHASSHSFHISEPPIVKAAHTPHIAKRCAMRGSVNPYGRSRNVTIALSIVHITSTYLSSLKKAAVSRD